MRVVQYRTNAGIRVGVVNGERVVDVATAAERQGKDARAYASGLALLEAGAEAMEFISGLKADSDSVPIGQAQLTFPVEARKIVAIGLNYKDHAEEAGQPIPMAPLCFAKFTSSLSGPFDAIRLPDENAQVDFEGELGVVIGQTARNVAKAKAMEYVAGYLTFNDVSERRWQFADGQWTRGKSCDTFAPNGPWLVTRDEVPDPGKLKIRTRINGELMQDSSTDQLIFSVAELISYLSKSFTFYPGDIIATGTPPGVGFSRKPPRFLQLGDVVEVEIENIGKIANRVERAQ